MKIAIAFVIALICWGYPIHTASQAFNTADQPQPNIETKLEVKERSNEPLPPNPPTAKTKVPAKNVGNTSTLGAGTIGGRNYEGRAYSREEVIQLIISYSQQLGINPEVPLCIAKLESGYNQFAKNKSSSASGVFQYLSSTWRGTDEHKQGLSALDAEANVRAAIKYMASRKNTKPWTVAPKCPSL